MDNLISQNPQENQEQNAEKNYGIYLTIAGWVFQIIVWVSLSANIYVLTHYYAFREFTGLIFGISYLIYLIIEIISPTFQYINNIITEQRLYEKMTKLFETPPKIMLKCKCYHYETRNVNIRGKIERIKLKIATYRETYDFPYYTSRDISGLLSLDYDKDYIRKKPYIQLELEKEINFADSISYSDYIREKENFRRRNYKKDQCFELYEEKQISGFKENILVNLTKNEPFFTKRYIYAFFTILAFGEFYTLYFNLSCIHQKFKIRKLISTRYELNQPEYQRFDPQINSFINQSTYTNINYYYKNDNYEVQLPTEEELEIAKFYKDKIPNYQISVGETI